MYCEQNSIRWLRIQWITDKSHYKSESFTHKRCNHCKQVKVCKLTGEIRSEVIRSILGLWCIENNNTCLQTLVLRSEIEMGWEGEGGGISRGVMKMGGRENRHPPIFLITIMPHPPVTPYATLVDEMTPGGWGSWMSEDMDKWGVRDRIRGGDIKIESGDMFRCGRWEEWNKLRGIS